MAFSIRYISRKILRSCKAGLLPDARNSSLRWLNYSAVEYGGKQDPGQYFIRKDVQSLLKSLTRMDINKVFKQQKLGGKLETPTYKFMTSEELEAAYEEARQTAEKLLQMPPIVKIRKEINKTFSVDPELKGLDTARFVFTDISFGVCDMDRLIVVREPDGTLREAEWQLKDRINQIYFPKPHRQITPPKMFYDSYFEDLLKRKEYIFVLDRACCQFEPNDPEYHRVTSITYQYVNDNNDFEMLRSTRHFGCLTFFLVWHKNIDNLLLDVIETSHVNEAKDLIMLYGLIHKVNFHGKDDVEVITEYVKKYSNKKGALELALQAYLEFVKQRKELADGLKAAHGHN